MCTVKLSTFSILNVKCLKEEGLLLHRSVEQMLHVLLVDNVNDTIKFKVEPDVKFSCPV